MLQMLSKDLDATIYFSFPTKSERHCSDGSWIRRSWVLTFLAIPLETIRPGKRGNEEHSTTSGGSLRAINNPFKPLSEQGKRSLGHALKFLELQPEKLPVHGAVRRICLNDYEEDMKHFLFSIIRAWYS